MGQRAFRFREEKKLFEIWDITAKTRQLATLEKTHAISSVRSNIHNIPLYLYDFHHSEFLPSWLLCSGFNLFFFLGQMLGK